MSLHDPLNPIFPGVHGAVTVASNSALGVYAMLFLTIRLLIHRRRLMKTYQDKALTKQYCQITTILLESAVVNIPIAIAAAVGDRAGKTFSEVIGLIGPPSQVCAYCYWFNTTCGILGLA